MTETIPRTWRGVREEVLRRIKARDWPPGATIPNEADLATELGCARTTVNRALRELARAGILERRRKSGTRVAPNPIGRAVVEIPILRQEVEALGRAYGYTLVDSAAQTPPPEVAQLLHTRGPALHIRALHSADGRPYVAETRWISLDAVPAARGQDFATTSANEWLVQQVPYTRGELSIGAAPCPAPEAALLGVATGETVLTVDRTTYADRRGITCVRMRYPPGHRITSALMG